jgi:hypothetical protein
MGGILEVADVPGFLGNLKEMYERADAEGGVWRSFVALWWDRLGTQQVSVADLYELALQSGIPLARGTSTPSEPASAKRSGVCAIESTQPAANGCASGMRALRTESSAGRWRSLSIAEHVHRMLVGLVGLIRGRNQQCQVGLRRGPPEAHLKKPWKIKAPVGLVGLVGLFHPFTCARMRAR